MIDTAPIIQTLQNTGKSRIIVFGDFTLDKYLYIDPARDEVSVETGLVAYQVHEKRLYAGSGGTIANNLRALGAQVSCIGLVGIDGEGYELLRCLRDIGADTSGMVQDSSICTSTYTKPMRLQPDGTYQELNRLDFRNFQSPSAELGQQVLEQLEQALPHADAVILIDQFFQRNLGVITDAVRSRLNDLAKQHSDKIFYADSRACPDKFRNMIVKCNNYELMAMTPDLKENPEDVQAICNQVSRLNKEFGSTFYVTLGSKGMIVFEKGQSYSVPAVSVKGPIDIVGAGDASSAGIVLGLTLGLTPQQAAVLACCVSAITIQQIGVTGTASVPQVTQQLEKYQEG